jgi:hypothetical protein
MIIPYNSTVEHYYYSITEHRTPSSCLPVASSQ